MTDTTTDTSTAATTDNITGATTGASPGATIDTTSGTAIGATSVATRPVVLVVQGDITVVESGARHRFRDALEWTVRRFAHVTVYSFRNDPDRPWDAAAVARFHALFPGVALVLDDKTAPHRLFTRAKLVCAILAPSRIADLLRLRLPGATPAFEALRRRLRSPCFFLCGIDNLADLNGVGDVTAVADTLDLKFVHHGIVGGRPVFDWRIIARMRMELGLLARCRATIAISRTEAAVLGTLLPDVTCVFLPSFGAGALAAPPKTGAAHRHDLLFVGTAYHFNVIGLAAFLRENESWLRPFRIAIAGKVSLDPAIVSLVADWPSVSLLGFVDDLRPVYREAKLALSPVEGTGLKIKILEALTNATPVAASASSTSGLPSGFEACVFPLDRLVIEDLLRDETALRAAERAIPSYLARAFGAETEREALYRLMTDAPADGAPGT